MDYVDEEMYCSSTRNTFCYQGCEKHFRSESSEFKLSTVFTDYSRWEFEKWFNFFLDSLGYDTWNLDQRDLLTPLPIYPLHGYEDNSNHTLHARGLQNMPKVRHFSRR